MDLKRIGRKIRKVRRDADLTVDNIAELTGMANGTVSMIERGVLNNPGITTLWNICEALCLDLSELIKNSATAIPQEKEVDDDDSKIIC